MNCFTHLLGGAALTTAACITAPQYFGTIGPVTLMAGLVGSLIPDIDHPKSTISNMTLLSKAISKTVTSATKHRGVCHSIAFIIAVHFLLTRFVVGNISFFTAERARCLAAGMMSHILLDMLNPAGVSLFWPFGKKRIKLMYIKTGTFGEYAVAFILVAAEIAMLVTAFLLSPATI